MIFDKAILRKYAQLESPHELPLSIYFTHTEHTLTVFDAYPKAVFHFLVLPRIKDKDKDGPFSAANLVSLKKFLNSRQTTRNDIKALLKHLKEDAEKVCEMIVEEMRSRYGFVWNVHVGFHAVQSMDHIHLHIISEDLCAPGLKTKKHYNSFHPQLGFFLHLDDVLSWFEEDKAESYIRSVTKLDETVYEKKLKEPLECHHCGKEQRNIPTLKAHLREHFDRMAQKRKATEMELDKKRKRDEDHTEEKSRRDPHLKQETQTEKKALAPDSAFEASSSLEEDASAIPRKKQKSV